MTSAPPPQGVAEIVRDAVLRAFGIQTPPNQVDRLAPLVDQAVRAGLVRDLPGFVAEAPAGGALTRWLAQQVTVDESYFFRNLDHFKAVEQYVLPELVRRRAATRHLRVLSAGASRGQEAYTLAMVLTEQLPADWTFEVVGFDVNPTNVIAARAGRYSTWSLRSAVPAPYERWIERVGNEVIVHSALRDRVRFHERNLMDPDPTFWASHAFDLVFFRNVAIYLSAEAYRDVISRVATALGTDGYLFLSESETLRGVSDAFAIRRHGDAIFYERSDTPPSPAPRPPPPPPPTDAWRDEIAARADRIRGMTDRPKVAPRPAPPRPAALRVADIAALARTERFSELAGLEVADTDAILAVAVAVGLLNSGQRDRATQRCLRVLAVSPHCADAHHLLALAQPPDQAHAAIAHDRAALNADPTFALARLHLALTLIRGGRRDLASPELDRALAAVPAEDDLRLALFGGGLDRDALTKVIRTARAACGASR